MAYSHELSETVNAKKNACSLPCKAEENLLRKLAEGSDRLYEAIEVLDEDIARAANYTDRSMLAFYFKETVIPAMNAVREVADEMELLTAKKYWPYPSCGDLLFSIG